MVLKRKIENKILNILEWSPSITLLGPRQIGKTTLANIIKSKLKKESIYLDLHNIEDYTKISFNKLFFEENKNRCVIIDEIQKYPQIFSNLRSAIDNHRIPARFIILGSASPKILKNAKESLTGRNIYIEINGINITEINDKITQKQHWFRGGYPLALLEHKSENRNIWFQSYIKNYIEYDLPDVGLSISPLVIYRLLSMIVNSNGSVWHASNLSNSLSITTKQLNLCRDYLEKTFLIRVIQPFFINIKKRMIKSLKIYIRDSGLLHYITKNFSFNDLLGHPIIGTSWEGYVIEQIINFINDNKSFEYEFCFYRTKDGSEIDLLIVKNLKPMIAIEIKLNPSPSLSKGTINAIKYLETKYNYVIVPQNEYPYNLNNGFKVISLKNFINEIKEII